MDAESRCWQFFIITEKIISIRLHVRRFHPQNSKVNLEFTALWSNPALFAQHSNRVLIDNFLLQFSGIFPFKIQVYSEGIFFAEIGNLLFMGSSIVHHNKDRASLITNQILRNFKNKFYSWFLVIFGPPSVI